jgi:hypothetical protein
MSGVRGSADNTCPGLDNTTGESDNTLDNTFSRDWLP